MHSQMYGYMMPELPIEPPEIPESKVAHHCDYCGAEIYKGEDFYKIGEDIIHEDCLFDYAKENLLVTAEE